LKKRTKKLLALWVMGGGGAIAHDPNYQSFWFAAGQAFCSQKEQLPFPS
jgi:hypothetical protein